VEDVFIISLRMLERLMVVGFGGMSIYLGYKLFFHLPHQTDQQGEIELPGMKVVLSRVGPGVFFLVFGAFILITNLHQGIVTRSERTQNASSIESVPHSNTHQQFADAETDPSVDETGESVMPYAMESEVHHFVGAVPVLPSEEAAGEGMSEFQRYLNSVTDPERMTAIEHVGGLVCIGHLIADVGKMNLRRENLLFHSAALYLLPVWDEAWGKADQLTKAEVPISNPVLQEILNGSSVDCAP